MGAGQVEAWRYQRVSTPCNGCKEVSVHKFTKSFRLASSGKSVQPNKGCTFRITLDFKTWEQDMVVLPGVTRVSRKPLLNMLFY